MWPHKLSKHPVRLGQGMLILIPLVFAVLLFEVLTIQESENREKQQRTRGTTSVVNVILAYQEESIAESQIWDFKN